MLTAGLAGWAALAAGRTIADAARGAGAAAMWLASGGQPDALDGWALGAGAGAGARRGGGLRLLRLLVVMLAASLAAYTLGRSRSGERTRQPVPPAEVGRRLPCSCVSLQVFLHGASPDPNAWQVCPPPP